MERRSQDRRSAYGSALLTALGQSQPLSFSELVSAAGGAEVLISEVLAWLRQAEVSGLVEVVAPLRAATEAVGPRRVRLTAAGAALAFGSRRRGRDRRAAA